MEQILLLAKVLESVDWKTFPLKETEEELGINAGDCLHILTILKKAGALDFKVIPWDPEEPTDIEKALKKYKMLPPPDPKTQGVLLFMSDKKNIQAIIKNPALLDPVIKKLGLYIGSPHFDEKASKIYYKDKNCDIPSGNQFILCKIVFGEPFGTLIPENDIADQIDLSHAGDSSKRTVYDAMLAVNEKMRKSFGIENIMEWKSGKVKIRKELFQ